jgi:hypothetical protein
MTKERSSRPRPLTLRFHPRWLTLTLKEEFTMVLISILLDLIALGGYFLVTASTTQPVFWLLTIVESIIVVILIGFFFSYRGKRRSRFYDPDIGARPYTIRFSIIAVSLFVNGAALFVYIMAIRGNSIF